MEIKENTNIEQFAETVANFLEKEYGTHNYEIFQEVLKKHLTESKKNAIMS